MLRPWLYERDAPTVLARRNEAYAALHAKTSAIRFGADVDSLERFREHVLREGAIHEGLESLPLGDDPVLACIEVLDDIIEQVVACDDEVSQAKLKIACAALLEALEAACEEDVFPRELWTGSFRAPPTPRDEASTPRTAADTPSIVASCLRGSRPAIQSCDLLAELVARFGDAIRDDVTRVRLLQDDRAVWLEMTTDDGRGGEKVTRDNLDFICDGDDEMFRATRSPLSNTALLLACDLITMFHCFDFLKPERFPAQEEPATSP